ncbi:hypothetical protein BOTBODRAFT_279816 [Botryobasidium botryosum FD-172 SS1]|uniref:F-box domain-containing protein n=1 Tax=Botryobasidium botryosum (strain FD-172 SS1) TaxID=930990 RepID=A0A067M233_BOTB1|nr:hypothetical protein BOTBODRAFT_279816 [Botryobasidium botryosum FD-172 SS1]
MKLTQLNYEVLLNICSFIKTRRSLLNLGLTCHALRAVIIPAVLYERIDFPRHLCHAASIQRSLSFFNAIRANRSACGAVRHIEIPGEATLCPSWEETIPMMRGLCSVGISMSHAVQFPILGKIAALPHLRSLSLTHSWDADVLDAMSGIGRLRSLSVDLTDSVLSYDLTLDSGLGQTLINSRDTLRTLTLSNFWWKLDMPSACPVDQELVWPHVLELSIHLLRGSWPNLVYHFPSVRQCHLDCISTELGQSFNQPFLARLVSLQGGPEALKLAKDAGAGLQHTRIRVGNDHVKFPFDSYMSPELKSVTLEYYMGAGSSPLEHFEQLPSLCPKVTYLAILWGFCGPSYREVKVGVLC